MHKRSALRLLLRQRENVRSAENRAARMALNNENAMLMQMMEDSNPRQLWRLTNPLIKVRNGALTHKDVKNEDRPDYVNENKEAMGKVDENASGFLAENARIRPYIGAKPKCF